jgi:hypothetical protein
MPHAVAQRATHRDQPLATDEQFIVDIGARAEIAGGLVVYARLERV